MQRAERGDRLIGKQRAQRKVGGVGHAATIAQRDRPAPAQ
jgi:hypothetical protein